MTLDPFMFDFPGRVKKVTDYSWLVESYAGLLEDKYVLSSVLDCSHSDVGSV